MNYLIESIQNQIDRANKIIYKLKNVSYEKKKIFIK